MSGFTWRCCRRFVARVGLALNRKAHCSRVACGPTSLSSFEASPTLVTHSRLCPSLPNFTSFSLQHLQTLNNLSHTLARGQYIP